MVTILVTCPDCGLTADKISQQITAATMTTTVQKSHNDMERLCHHLERRSSQSLFCPVLQQAVDVAPAKLNIVMLKGKDKYDLDKQQWEWRSAHPRAVIVKQWPDEALPLALVPLARFEKILAPDSVSRRIEYTEE